MGKGKKKGGLPELSEPTAKPHDAKSPEAFLKKDARIIIIGAGPAGIHMAHELKERGFTNVKILEKECFKGGKTLAYYNRETGEFPYSMGALFMHTGYLNTMKLADQYGIEYYDFSFSPCEVYTPDLNDTKEKPREKARDLMPWMFASIEADTLPKSCWCLPNQVQILSISDALQRYKTVHHSIFGRYEYGLPPRPDEATLEKMNMSYLEFLRHHRLDALIPLLTMSFTVQGFGYLDTTPAFYGLWFISPKFVEDVLSRKTNIMMFKKGFQTLWVTMAERDGLDILLNTEVTRVDRNLDHPEEPVRIEALVEGQPQTFEADFVIAACPLKPFFTQTFSDATPEEKELFENLEFASLTTTVFRSGVKNPEEKPMIFFPERLNRWMDGRLYAEKTTAREFVDDAEVRFSVAYQYYQDFDESRAPTTLKNLEVELKEFGYRDVKLLYHRNWEYCPRYSHKNLKKLYPWRILDLQGKNRTWYAGSSVSFESVEDVVCYNLLLLKLFKIDEKPAEKPADK